jgi:hypothetical protein
VRTCERACVFERACLRPCVCVSGFHFGRGAGVPLAHSYYVIGRRLRETFKSQCLNPLKRARGPRGALALEAIDAAAVAATARLRRGMEALTWVPDCAEKHAVWAEVAIGFVEWFLGRVRAAGGLTDALVAEVENTFASLLVRYFTETGRPVGF